jgi:phage shock protein C
MADRYAADAASGDGSRVWRRDGRAMFAGVCAGLAEDLDLPLPVVRMVAVLFWFLPTGLAYVGLALILRRREGARVSPRPGRVAARTAAGTGGRVAAAPTAGDWALLRHRFEMLEPRLGRIEAFVTAPEFELHRDFRRMGD